MAITEYFSSLADNPYFGAGSGIFALGNVNPLNLCEKLIHFNFRSWRCGTSKSIARRFDPSTSAFNDNAGSSLP